MASSKQILESVFETLDTVQIGFKMLQSGDPAMRKTGLRNVIVFGRAVTNVLQKLRSIVPNFDDWYQPWVERMRADPVMAHFYKLRSEILKEGKLATNVSVHIHNVNFGALMAAVPKPPGATSFFIGDSNGGTGWLVPTSDGEQKFYVQLPQTTPRINLSVNMHLADAPGDLGNVSVETLAAHYLQELQAMCEQARQQFNGS